MKRFSLALSLCLFVSLAHAGISTSLSMPIADVLKHREAQVMYTAYGNERNVDKGYVHEFSFCAGLSDRFELAASSDGLGNGVWHAKALLFETKNAALSAGLQNINGAQSDPFVVARYDLPGLRLHGGWTRDDASRALLGVDVPINDVFTSAVEHATGPNGYTWVGGFIAVPKVPGVSLTVGIGLPNTKADGVQHQLGVTYTVRF